MSQEVMEKARELGMALTKTPEFRDVKVKQSILFSNEVTLEMLKVFHGMQENVQRKVSQGEEVSQDDTRALEQMELKMSENRAFSEFQHSQKKYQELINKVLEIVIGVQKDVQDDDES